MYTANDIFVFVPARKILVRTVGNNVKVTNTILTHGSIPYKDWYQFQPVIKSDRTQTLSALFHAVLRSYNRDELLEIQPVQNYA